MIIGEEEFRERASRMTLEPPGARFYFLRHGQTDGNAARIVQSPVIPLNETGRAQARAAAEVLAGRDIDRIAASSFPRAYETAQILARRVAKPMDATPRLGERLFGELVGQGAAALDWRARPSGGETLDGFIRRTIGAVGAALAGGGVPCVVAHGGNLRVVVYALGLAFGEAHAGNATPIRFDRSGGGWTATVLGDAAPA